MGSLSPYVSKESETVKAIYAWHEKMEATREGPHRGRLGASVIGKPCDRELWYGFRELYQSKFDGRMLRLFETGHLEEKRFVRELRGIGCRVHAGDSATGEQFEFTALGGHFVCHPDAVVLGIKEAPETWHSCEMKTMCEKDFNKTKRDGVLKSKPEHHAQTQIAMGMAKLTRALYVFRNKNTDHIWTERLKRDTKCFKQLMDRAERIIRSNNPPERRADRPDSFTCRFCDAFQLCWGTGKVAVPLPAKTCRSCCHATPEIDEGENWARWKCEKHGIDISYAEQKQACDCHLLLPGLISFAEPVDSGDDWIEFKNTSDGAVWRHGNGKGMWTTEELMRTPGPLVGEKAVDAVKEAFGATVTEFDDGKELTLVEQYPPGDSRRVWDGDPLNKDKVYTELCKALGIQEGEPLPTPTNEYKDDAHEAYEFNKRILLVIYKEHGHAAIWEGVE